jgi:hypothetical protein
VRKFYNQVCTYKKINIGYGWPPGRLRVGSGSAPGGFRVGSGLVHGGLRVGSAYHIPATYSFIFHSFFFLFYFFLCFIAIFISLLISVFVLFYTTPFCFFNQVSIYFNTICIGCSLLFHSKLVSF